MNEEKEILSKVFYTSVQNPEDIGCIEIRDQEKLKIINNFVEKITRKKLKQPKKDLEPRFSEGILSETMEIGLEIDAEKVKNLFETLSKYMYGRAREQGKYWCLILTQEYFFLYHFTPDRAVSFENDSIREFIKYLDDSNLLKFIFKLKRESITNFFGESPGEDMENSEFTNFYGIFVFDKYKTKGIEKLVGKEPEYEFKGRLRVRVKRSEKTDIIVETFLEDLENINSNIKFNFQEKKATIKIEEAPIEELIIDEKKYDVITGLKRVKFETLGIGEFMEKYNFYKEENREIREYKKYILVGDKRIDKPDKPENNLKGKEETVYILGDIVNNDEDLIKNCFEAIKNNFNVGFAELSEFAASYSEINIGRFTIFAKLENNDRVQSLENTFKNMLNNVINNLTLEKTLHYVGLLTLSEFLKSKGFREKLYKIAKLALNDYYSSMPDRNIELKEIDKLGIEFKTGIKIREINGKREKEGFFNPSPIKFAEEVVKKFDNKRKDTVIFFVGIHEDTRTFSPIPLNEIRNEFHEDFKKYVASIKPSMRVLLSETIPVSSEEGIIILVLQK